MSTSAEGSVNQTASGQAPSLSARRARLRSSLNKTTPAEPEAQNMDLNLEPPVVAAPTSTATSNSSGSLESPSTINLLNSIDQTMNACATNLAALHEIARQQTEALKNLAETLQNQTFNEMGLNLASLSDSISGALKPMKKVGELANSIEHLVTSLNAKPEAQPVESELVRMAPEKLVTNLAEQLSVGAIDSWTFKSAYMAVYPGEQQADLLHRLVDLLGNQKLSADLFRVAYESVQAAIAPAQPIQQTSLLSDIADSTIESAMQAVPVPQIIDTEEEESRNRQQAELAKSLEAREQELSQIKDMFDSRMREFNNQYDSLQSTLSERDGKLKELSDALTQKDSENQQLKAQMEELRDQTKDLVSDLQRQIATVSVKKIEEEVVIPAQAKPKSSGFFDVAVPAQAANFFDQAPATSVMPQEEVESSQTPQPQSPPQPRSSRLAATGGGAVPVNPFIASPSKEENASATPPRKADSSPSASPSTSSTSNPVMSGAGSYGSGVRAQVFEVIVRQALAGAPWKEICTGPMQVNNISVEEVEAEVKRRQALLKK